VSSDNPYEAPAARVDDRQPDAPSLLPRAAAALALLFAGGMLAMLLLEVALAPAPVRLIEHVDMLTVVLAAVLVGLGLWRYSAWGWWVGLLGGGYVLMQAVLRVKGEELAPDPHMVLGATTVVFSCCCPTVRFTRSLSARSRSARLRKKPLIHKPARPVWSNSPVCRARHHSRAGPRQYLLRVGKLAPKSRSAPATGIRAGQQLPIPLPAARSRPGELLPVLVWFLAAAS
jgi:hypothetical protein